MTIVDHISSVCNLEQGLDVIGRGKGLRGVGLDRRLASFLDCFKKPGAVRQLVKKTAELVGRRSGFKLFRDDRQRAKSGPEWKVQLELWKKGCKELSVRAGRFKGNQIRFIGLEVPLKAPKGQLKGRVTLRGNRNVDLLAIDVHGRLWAVEVKKLTERAEPVQGVFECALYQSLLRGMKADILSEANKSPKLPAELRDWISEGEKNDLVGSVLLLCRSRQKATGKARMKQKGRMRKLEQLIGRLESGNLLILRDDMPRRG